MTELEHGHVILYSYLWRENSIAAKRVAGRLGRLV